MKYLKGKLLKGDSMIEVMLALMLMAVLASSLFVLLAGQMLKSGQSQSNTEALALAEEGLAAARSIRDTGWDSLALGGHGVRLNGVTWQFDGTQDVTDEIYTRTVAVTQPSTNQRLVVSTVQWEGPGERQQSVQLSTILTNWRNASQAQTWGDWRYPIIGGSIDLGAGNQGTGIAVKNKRLYVTGNASDSKKKDFYVIDATDYTNPYIMGSIDTGTGLTDVAVSGTYAFVATYNQTKKLQVIDVANPNAPVLKVSLETPNALQWLQKITLSGRYLYMSGLTDNKGEFVIVDVSNPLAPVMKGKLALGKDVNGVAIKGNRAYLATNDSAGEIIIVDISDPMSPSVIKSVNMPGSGIANDVYFDLARNRAFLAREPDGVETQELVALDISDIENPTVIGGVDAAMPFKGVVESNNLAFISVGDANNEFQVFSITNISAPVRLSTLNYPQDVMDMALENNVVYVAVRSNDAVKIITAH